MTHDTTARSGADGARPHGDRRRRAVRAARPTADRGRAGGRAPAGGRARCRAGVPVEGRARVDGRRVRPARAGGVWGGVLCRKRYADDKVAEAFGAGIEQLVVLGAGLDTRACRADAAGRAGL
ncbi:class I SAM-dependent methyltransferase [Nonomuraea ferruginea]